MSQAELVAAASDESGSVRILTLNRPDRLNAMTPTLVDVLLAHLDTAEADARVGAVVLTGAGRAFCAGADLSTGTDGFSSGEDDALDLAGAVSLRLLRFQKPLIAAVNGPAVGAGATITLAADLRLCAATACFGFVFTSRGIVTDGCASWLLPRVVGISRALQWCLEGEFVSATESREAGFVRSVHPADELLGAAIELARKIAARTSRVATSLVRTLMWNMLSELQPETAHALESRLIHELLHSADAREGVASFAARRAPEFPGRVPDDLPSWWPRDGVPPAHSLRPIR
jgi:enoyl-CoA hydratase/carnithine racemase